MTMPQHLTDDQLRQTLRNLAAKERLDIINLAEHLVQVLERELHLRWGFASMWAYCHQDLRLKDGVAHLRITLAKLLHRRPELKPLLIDGRLGHCTACELWSHVEAANFAELVEIACTMSKRDFKDYLAQLSGEAKPQRDVIRRTGADAQPMAAVPRTEEPCQPESEAVATGALFHTPASSTVVKEPTPAAASEPTASHAATPEASQPAKLKTHRISFSATSETVEMLRKLQDILGVQDIGSIAQAAFGALLDSKDPIRRAARRRPRRKKHKTQPTKRSRRPPAALADSVKVRDQEQCTFEAEDGTRCTAKRQLQIDHKIPFALGGRSDDERNLRCMCAAHNRMLARDIFGTKVPRRPQPVEVNMRHATDG